LAGAISDPGNVSYQTMPLQTLGAAATLVPAALSVQVMNANALQTTNGVSYIGRMNIHGMRPGDIRTVQTFADEFVSYQTPRLMANPRLCLRGVQLDSAPLDMNDLSDFTHINPLNDTDGVQYAIDQPYSAGWAPIVVYNPGETKLEYLVTIEWRIRFDLSNPASGGHIHHPIATDSMWDRLTRMAFALGNGVRDISQVAETVGRYAPLAIEA
jgi:hypothetical protein